MREDNADAIALVRNSGSNSKASSAMRFKVDGRYHDLIMMAVLFAE